MDTNQGYTFSLANTEAPAGENVPVTFTINDPAGRRVTTYDARHEKKLHLIAVRRDFSGFQHVHPRLDANGTWRIELDLTPGRWRLFADFKATAAEPLTLGADLSVPGTVSPAARAVQTRLAQVDGYTLTLAGDPAPGSGTHLTVTVAKDGVPVTDLQPYLGAYGHLVALREGDLAYLHVHPGGAPGDGITDRGPEITFHTVIPSAGTYQLYLDFRHQGVVRTAQFTVAVATRL